MNKLKIWLIPGLLVVLTLIGLVYLRGQVPKQTPSTREVKTEVEVVSKPKGFAKAPEPSAQKKAEQDAVAMVDALNAGDLSECTNITWSEELRLQCEDNVNYAIVIKSSDPGQCEVLHNKDLKVQCYDKIHMSLAVDEKDSEWCQKIIDEELKQMCLDQVLMIVAHSADSVEDCAQITSVTLRKQCEDNFYLKSSAKTLDENGCDSISDPTLAQKCRQTVTQNIRVMNQSKQAEANSTTVKSPQEILLLCNGLNEKKATMCKDAVYPQLAFSEKDLSYCRKISDEEKEAECIEDQTERINTYYLRQAIASRDKSLCEEITDGDLKTVCRNS